METTEIKNNKSWPEYMKGLLLANSTLFILSALSSGALYWVNGGQTRASFPALLWYGGLLLAILVTGTVFVSGVVTAFKGKGARYIIISLLYFAIVAAVGFGTCVANLTFLRVEI